jgi:hypothetical protein
VEEKEGRSRRDVVIAASSRQSAHWKVQKMIVGYFAGSESHHGFAARAAIQVRKNNSNKPPNFLNIAVTQISEIR